MQYNHDILDALNGMLEQEIEEALSKEELEYNEKVRKIADEIPEEELAKIMSKKELGGRPTPPAKAHKIFNKNTWQIDPRIKKAVENFKVEDLKEGQIDEALLQVFETEIQSTVDPDVIRDDLSRELNKPNFSNPKFKVEVKPLDGDDQYHVSVYVTIGSSYIRDTLNKVAKIKDS